MPDPRAVRPRRRIIEATAAASLLGGAPSLLHALRTGGVGGATRYGVEALRAIGTLVPPWRPSLPAGVVVHFSISAAAGELLGRLLPERHALFWAAGAGATMGLIGVGVIGRRSAAIRQLPFGLQVADNVAFGLVFAAVADRRSGRVVAGG